MEITEETLRKKIVENDITRVDHHPCGICQEWVGYTIKHDVGVQGYIDIYFDPSCGCASSNPRIVRIDELLKFLNHNSENEKFRERLPEIFT